MMSSQRNYNYFFFSAIIHIVLFGFFIVRYQSTAPLPVFENTNQHAIINTVILGDKPDSKILTERKVKEVPSVQSQKKVLPKPVPLPQPTEKMLAINKAIIKKKIALKKVEDEKKIHDDMQKKLLADIEKQTQDKKLQTKKMKAQFAKTLKEQTEESLRQQLLKEEIRLANAKKLQTQGIVNKYKALILQTISSHWIIPPFAKKNLYCELMIRLAPGGMVLSVEVIKTSGDPSLDSSARAAVMKASPLPVPTDPETFEPFRHFVLKVKPENIMAALA